MFVLSTALCYKDGPYNANVLILNNITCMSSHAKNSNILARFPATTEVLVGSIDTNEGTQWGTADCGGKRGYIPMNQTQPVNPTDPVKPYAYPLGSFNKPVHTFMVVNCYSNTGYNYTLLNQLPNDTTIQVGYIYNSTDKSGEWGSCTCNGVSGYIPLEFTYPDVAPPHIYVTAQQLSDLGWTGINTMMVDEMNQALGMYGITTTLRLRHFLSQAAGVSTLGKNPIDKTDGSQYENRRDLGNTQPGDGPKFKNAGYIPILGRTIFQLFSTKYGDVRIMEGAVYVSKTYPWTAAGFWWNTANMNALCDTNPTVEAVTRRVDGNANELAQRQAEYDKCVKVIK